MQGTGMSRILGVMSRRLALVLAWLGATVLAVGVASAAVGTVRNQVTDRPQTTDPFFAAAPVADASSTTLGATTTLPATSATTTTLASTTTTLASTTLANTVPTTSATTTTTRPPTTTTAPPTTPITTTHDLVGGSVTITAASPNVSLVGAVPSSGFTVKVENAGPSEVRVEFDSESWESEFSAKWDDGELKVRTDEHDDD
jgi:cytoskeletal protein RodZ